MLTVRYFLPGRETEVVSAISIKEDFLDLDPRIIDDRPKEPVSLPERIKSGFTFRLLRALLRKPCAIRV